MDKLLNTANVLVSLAALVTASGPIAAAGAGVTGLLSWRAIRNMAPAAPDLAAVLARSMKAELDERGIPEDQHALIADMIAGTLPEPSSLIDASLDPERVLAQMEARLQGAEQRSTDSLHLFQIVLRPRLQHILTDPEFTATLAPAFIAGVIARLDGLDETTRATLLGVLRVEAKIDLLPGQFAELLQNLNRASRDQLEALAARFEIAGAYDLTDAALREKLDKRAEDWRALRREIAAIPETMKQLSNLKGAAQAAFDAGRFDEVEMLLERVHQVELEEAAKTAELRAETALLRGRVDQALTLLASAADSLKPIDPLKPARRRILRYFAILRNHGLRYGGLGIARGLDLLAAVLNDDLRKANAWLWAAGMNAQAIGLSDLGERTGGPEGAALRGQAVAAYSKALEVYTRADHPVHWAMTQNNLGAALQEQGSRTGGREGAALLGQAVAAYSKALEVRTRADHPVQWAMTQNNLGAALRAQGERTGGREGAALLGQAVAAYSKTLEVRTRADHPVQWAMTQENLAIVEVALAQHDTCPDPAPHLRAALAHVEAALEVYDPEHMPHDHGTATALRERIRKALEGGGQNPP